MHQLAIGHTRPCVPLPAAPMLTLPTLCCCHSPHARRAYMPTRARRAVQVTTSLWEAKDALTCRAIWGLITEAGPSTCSTERMATTDSTRANGPRASRTTRSTVRARSLGLDRSIDGRDRPAHCLAAVRQRRALLGSAVHGCCCCCLRSCTSDAIVLTPLPATRTPCAPHRRRWGRLPECGPVRQVLQELPSRYTHAALAREEEVVP